MTEDESTKEAQANETPPEDGAEAAPAHAEADPLVQIGDPAQTAEAELFPQTGVDAAGAEDVPESAAEKHDSDVEEAKPFATSDAPWVGAEEKWLAGAGNGAAGPEHEPEAGKDEPPASDAKPVSLLGEDDDALLLSPQQIPVLPSLIPPPRAGMGTGAKIGIAAAVAVVLAAGAMVWWMNQRFAERAQEILALRASDKQDVSRLEAQIRELLAKGGSANQQRASELQAELDAAQAGSAPIGPEIVGAETEEERRRRHERDSDTRDTASGDVARAPAEPATPYDEPAAATAPAGTAGAKSPDEEDLLASAFTKPAAAAGGAPAPIQGATEFPLGGTALPKSPSRDQVKTAMDAIAPQVRKCGGEPGGRVVVSLAVAGATGRVLSAEPSGDAAGTPLGLCAARAVKLAKFPPFQQDRLQIKYPFDL